MCFFNSITSQICSQYIFPSKEFVTLNPVFLNKNMVFVFKLEHFDRLSDSNVSNFAKPRMLNRIVLFHVEYIRI